MRKALAPAAMAVTLLSSTPVFSTDCYGVRFADTVKIGSADFVLNGLGIRKATIFSVKVYIAGLYLREKLRDPKQILSKDRPWQLVLRFVHDVEGVDIHDAFSDGFDKSTSGKSEPMRAHIESINALVPDLVEGDTLTFTHLVGEGVGVEINGTPKGEIGNASFALAFLGISLGPTPPNESLKTGLLGGVCD